jgi:hypothetical protein
LQCRTQLQTREQVSNKKFTFAAYISQYRFWRLKDPLKGHKAVRPFAEKSVPLLVRFIVAFSKVGDYVMDLFAGTASCKYNLDYNPNSLYVLAGAIGAIYTNRKFIGCEMDERCFELAEERLRRWVMYHTHRGVELGQFVYTAAEAVRHSDIAMLPFGDQNLPTGSPSLQEQLDTWQLEVKSSELEVVAEQDDGFSLVCFFCSDSLSLMCSHDWMFIFC